MQPEHFLQMLRDKNKSDEPFKKLAENEPKDDVISALYTMMLDQQSDYDLDEFTQAFLELGMKEFDWEACYECLISGDY